MAGSPATFDAASAHGRDRQGGVEEVAQRAALLGLAGAGCARRLEHARRPRAACRPFPQVKGSRILHDKLREFIHRNYAADERGAWFFQNGPQRVYVELEAAPFVASACAARWRAGSDQPYRNAGARRRCSWLDEQAGSFSPPNSASASCTRWTWAAADAVERARGAAGDRLRRAAAALRYVPARPTAAQA